MSLVCRLRAIAGICHQWGFQQSSESLHSKTKKKETTLKKRQELEQEKSQIIVA